MLIVLLIVSSCIKKYEPYVISNESMILTQKEIPSLPDNYIAISNARLKELIDAAIDCKALMELYQLGE